MYSSPRTCHANRPPVYQRQQAVRLPKEFRFEGDEVIIKKVGSAVILLPKVYASRDLNDLLDEIGPLDLERQQPETDQPRDFR